MHGGAALCVKKSAVRKGGMNFGSLPDQFYGIIVEVARGSKVATFCAHASSLSRLNSSAIPTAPHDFAMVFRRLPRTF
jgi:hypothetical protein